MLWKYEEAPSDAAKDVLDALSVLLGLKCDRDFCPKREALVAGRCRRGGETLE
jgi:hypothetical protein